MNNTVSSPTIAVIDYQAGNIRSVSNALKKFGANVLVTSDVAEIEGADGMVSRVKVPVPLLCIV